MRSLDGTAERDAIEDAFASHGMARAVEEFPQGCGVFVGECGVLLPRQRDDGFDVLRGAAWIGDKLARSDGDLARGHVFIRGCDDAGVLRLGEGALPQDLIVPQEVSVERRATVRGDGSGDAIVVLGITLRLLERLLAARRAAAEIRELWVFAIMRLHDLLAHDGHEVRGAIAEVLPHFFIADAGVRVRCGAHVCCRHDVTSVALQAEPCGIDLPRRPAIA